MLRRVCKAGFSGASIALVFLPAAASAFGRWAAVFELCAHAFAIVPGIFGDCLRTAFYKLTLSGFSLSSRISFGSFFAHPEASVSHGVYIGSYCVIGTAIVGERTQIASGVQILSGRRQHRRNQTGEISSSENGEFHPVIIGADCWIGAGAIVMADVGCGTTIGAGSVVSRPIPPRSTAVGNPARVIGTTQGAAPQVKSAGA